MKICDTTHCTGCGLCISACPRNAISFHQEADRRSVARIDDSQCVNCGLCQKRCPQNDDFSGVYPSKAYACWVRDIKKRENSSSGGIGYILAERWIQDGGIVFGAAWNGENVDHIAVTDVEDLWRISGSKYVQSDTTKAFRQIQGLLKSNKKVLFIGTPCQVAAAKKLEMDNDGVLATVDLVCHGVPPMNYLREYIGNEREDITYWGCRDQIKGKGIKKWKENGEKSFVPEKDDSWMRGFLHCFTLRDNCYTCRYSRAERCGDITIGDFWGLKRAQMPKYIPKFVSLAMVNTSLGVHLWNSIQTEIEAHQRPVSEAVDGNDNLRQPTPCPEKRDVFLKRLQETNSFNEALSDTLKLFASHKPMGLKFFLYKTRNLVSKIVCRLAELNPPKGEMARSNSVGIVTVGRKFLLMNYGTLMQHFALRKVLVDNHFSPWRLEGNNDFAEMRVRRWKRLMKGLFFKGSVESWLNRQFSLFLVKHYGKEWEMPQKDCVKYIIGSDQVWTTPNNHNLLDLRQDTVAGSGRSDTIALNQCGREIQKISYAASADWRRLSESEGSRYYLSDVLPSFRNISVREAEGVRILRDICPGKEVTQTIDPTLLLTKADYESIIPSKKIFNVPTLFCYFVNVRDRDYIKVERLERVASEKNLSLCMSGIQGAEDYIPDEYYLRLSPEDWLRAYRDASVIITNSFHGTVFALIFNKPFVMITQVEQEGRKQNLRLFELSEYYGCADRLISQEDNMENLGDILDREINWEEINAKIRQFASFSKKWLIDSLR